MEASTPKSIAQIREFRPASHADSTAFRELNEEWIKHYFVIEEDDVKVLGNPVRHILEQGGAILLAEIDSQIVGCCALIVQADEPTTYELAKLAVTAACQGRRLGRGLTEAAMAKAKMLGAKRLVLTTNSQLHAARRLYESLNFTYVSPAEAETFRGHYNRGDTFMELHLP
jgi:putative acetyltransferase